MSGPEMKGAIDRGAAALLEWVGHEVWCEWSRADEETRDRYRNGVKVVLAACAPTEEELLASLKVFQARDHLSRPGPRDKALGSS